MKWTEADVPDQTGKQVIVTGSNTGLGFETARVLAQKGADVVLACRSKGKGDAAAKLITNLSPAGSAKFAALDLADLSSIKKFAKSVKSVDVLVNNAGVMSPPFGKTDAGWEQQFGVNYIGHYLLTGLLYSKLKKSDGRVVTLSSIAHRQGKIAFDNLRGEQKYNPWREYQQSKLADMLFGLELARRQTAVTSVVAHPGVTHTDLMRSSSLADLGARMFAMSPAKGALPQIYAATMPVEAGSYWGPRGLREAWGYPGKARISRAGRDADVAGKLWQLGEDVTGAPFGF